jgi:hypothetical protein
MLSYLLTFGQHPKVGLSVLPINKDLITSLLTEKNIHDHLRLTDNVPQEDAVVNMSNRGDIKTVMMMKRSYWLLV